jgi:hypothetical protein
MVTWWMALLGCAVHAERSGLVSAPGDQVVLTTLEGRTLVLVVEGDGAWLRGCEGCEVTVTGPRWMGRIWVRDYDVRKAADGSAPFVGMLRRHGSNLVLDDRTTDRPVVFDEESMALLLPHEGHPVLVVGFVVGAQMVHVVHFVVLDSTLPAPVEVQ